MKCLLKVINLLLISKKTKFLKKLKGLVPTYISSHIITPCFLGSIHTGLLWIFQVPSCPRAFGNQWLFIIWNIQPIFSYPRLTQSSDLSLFVAKLLPWKSFPYLLLYALIAHIYFLCRKFPSYNCVLIWWLFDKGHLSHQMEMGAIIFLMLSILSDRDA